jgi:hypothetical protein
LASQTNPGELMRAHTTFERHAQDTPELTTTP